MRKIWVKKVSAKNVSVSKAWTGKVDGNKIPVQ